MKFKLNSAPTNPGQDILALHVVFEAPNWPEAGKWAEKFMGHIGSKGQAWEVTKFPTENKGA